MRRKSAEYDVVKREEVSFRSRVRVALMWRTAFLNEADRARNKVLADCTFRTAFRNALDELFDTKRAAVQDLASKIDSAQSLSMISHSEPTAHLRWRIVANFVTSIFGNLFEDVFLLFFNFGF